MNPEENKIVPEEPKVEVQPEPVKPEPIHSLRTFQGDVQEAMMKSKTSTTDIYLAEQKKKTTTLIHPEQPIDTEAKNKFFALVGIALLVLGVFTIGSVYYFRSTGTTATANQTKALIGFSQEKILPVASSTRESFVSNIISEKQSFKLPVNSILFLNTVGPDGLTPYNVEDFLNILAPNMPSSLPRSFDVKYMLGIYSFDTNEPFIILTTKDFPSSFAGMLQWEKRMPSDIGSIFGISPSTTTPAFVDQEFRNKDLRLLKDANNKTILLYSFIDKQTLIITKNETIFTAILTKYLVSGQTQ